jgi:hypothetical protein
MTILARRSLSRFSEIEIFHSTSKQAVFIFVVALLVRIAIAIHQHAWSHNMRAEMERGKPLDTTGVYEKQ